MKRALALTFAPAGRPIMMPISTCIQDHSDFHLIYRAFAHVAEKPAFLWGSPELHGFVQQLAQDTRQGACAGFPADVLFALARRSQAHDEAFPELAKAKPTVWSQSNFRQWGAGSLIACRGWRSTSWRGATCRQE